jgi:hypothetical protein
MASNSTRRSSEQATLTEGLAAVPTGAAVIVPGSTANKDVIIFQITVANTTAGAVTYTLEDGNSNQVLAAVSIAANTSYIAVWPEGLRMLKGALHTAGGSGLIAEVFGFAHA